MTNLPNDLLVESIRNSSLTSGNGNIPYSDRSFIAVICNVSEVNFGWQCILYLHDAHMYRRIVACPVKSLFSETLDTKKYHFDSEKAIRIETKWKWTAIKFSKYCYLMTGMNE